MTSRRLLDVTLATGHTFVLALLPLLTVTANFALASGGERLRPAAILVIIVCTAAALWATRACGGSLHARGAWLSTAIIVLGAFIPVGQ
jgi:hypothetical protein